MRKSLKACVSCQHCIICGGAGFCSLKMTEKPLSASARRQARVSLTDGSCAKWQRDELLGGEAVPLPDPLSKNGSAVCQVSDIGKIVKISTIARKPWSSLEVAKMQQHPDLTAADIAQMLGRTTSSVEQARHRFGRYATGRGVRLCQKCGQHPVNVQDPLANRWGFCAACALAEKEYQDKERDYMRRKNDARRQRKCKHNKKDKKNENNQ